MSERSLVGSCISVRRSHLPCVMRIVGTAPLARGRLALLAVPVLDATAQPVPVPARFVLRVLPGRPFTPQRLARHARVFSLPSRNGVADPPGCQTCAGSPSPALPECRPCYALQERADRAVTSALDATGAPACWQRARAG